MSVLGPDEQARALAQVLSSLDRCRHGRHDGERCFDCPDGLSAGNPHLRAGQKIGYDVHGEGLYVPGAGDFSDTGAWRTPPVDVADGDDPVTSQVYRERNRMVAGYTRRWPSVITEAPDYPGFWIVYIASPAGQLSWHIPERDMRYFGHVRRVESWEWDGHSTAEKYERLEQACAIWEGKA
jgi:hypothetical protein